MNFNAAYKAAVVETRRSLAGLHPGLGPLFGDQNSGETSQNAMAGTMIALLGACTALWTEMTGQPSTDMAGAAVKESESSGSSGSGGSSGGGDDGGTDPDSDNDTDDDNSGTDTE